MHMQVLVKIVFTTILPQNRVPFCKLVVFESISLRSRSSPLHIQICL